MSKKHEGLIGYTWAYTPLPLIAAAGFKPYRILPMGDTPDQAGQFLHDNLCPHVKKVLDCVLSGDVPALAGAVEAPEGGVPIFLFGNILVKPPCARTFFPEQPGRLAHDTLAAAKAIGAAGVIGHTVKFCDPYLARMPTFREEFKKAGMPFYCWKATAPCVLSGSSVPELKHLLRCYTACHKYVLFDRIFANEICASCI